MEASATNEVRKTVPQLGAYPINIRKEELLAIISMWQLAPETEAGVRQLIENDLQVRGLAVSGDWGHRTAKVAAAELAMSTVVGTRYCLAVNSLTSALITAFRALGIGIGDEVIIPSYAPFETPVAVVSSNAIPVIVDVDETLTIDAHAVDKAITPRTMAIVSGHMLGGCANMDAILDIAKRKGVPVVECVWHSNGGTFHGKRLGSIGTVGCSSPFLYGFEDYEGGAFITTDSKYLYTRAQHWHDCTASWQTGSMGADRMDGELFCGGNYKMSEIEGAIALSQICKIEKTLSDCKIAKNHIKSGINTYRGLNFCKLNDEAGDAGVCLTMFLPNAHIAQCAVHALIAEGVPARHVFDESVRDRNVYCFWEHILERRSVVADGLPWSAVPVNELPKYSADMCSRSLVLMGQAVVIEINNNYSERDCDFISAGINKVFRLLLR